MINGYSCPQCGKSFGSQGALDQHKDAWFHNSPSMGVER